MEYTYLDLPGAAGALEQRVTVLEQKETSGFQITATKMLEILNTETQTEKEN